MEIKEARQHCQALKGRGQREVFTDLLLTQVNRSPPDIKSAGVRIILQIARQFTPGGQGFYGDLVAQRRNQLKRDAPAALILMVLPIERHLARFAQHRIISRMAGLLQKLGVADQFAFLFRILLLKRRVDKALRKQLLAACPEAALAAQYVTG